MYCIIQQPTTPYWMNFIKVYFLSSHFSPSRIYINFPLFLQHCCSNQWDEPSVFTAVKIRIAFLCSITSAQLNAMQPVFCAATVNKINKVAEDVISNGMQAIQRFQRLTDVGCATMLSIHRNFSQRLVEYTRCSRSACKYDPWKEKKKICYF